MVVHFWNLTAPDAQPPDPVTARGRSFHSLVFLAQALGERETAAPCRIAVVSNGLHQVTGEESLDPAKALLLGPVTVIPQEYAELRCFSIDLDGAPRHRERQLGYLLADAAAGGGDTPIAYRGGYRWVQTFAPAPLPAREPPLRAGGVYLITGGTGGVGLALAEWLARSAPGVRLALLARSDPAPAEELVSAAARPGGPSAAIARLTRELGTEVVVLRADVSDPTALAGALGLIRERFGAIHGVIHAAGIADGGLIRVKTYEDAERQFAAKVDGSAVLDSLLADTPLDFFVMCSSLTSAIGGAGQAAYAAACSFQDAWAEARAAKGAVGLSLAIGWDRWENLGMAAAAEILYREVTGRDLPGGMAVAEGVAAFGRLLASAGTGRVVVSVCGLATRLRRSRAFQLGFAEARPGPLALHVRPDAAGDFVAPCSDNERLIAGIWQEELGIDKVGVRDDFFALGGDSLLAIKLTARLRQALGVPLNARALYDAPTIAALAEHVAAIRWATGAEGGPAPAEEEEEGVL